MNQLINENDNIKILPSYDKIPLDPCYLLTNDIKRSYEQIMSSAMSNYWHEGFEYQWEIRLAGAKFLILSHKMDECMKIREMMRPKKSGLLRGVLQHGREDPTQPPSDTPCSIMHPPSRLQQFIEQIAVINSAIGNTSTGIRGPLHKVWRGTVYFSAAAFKIYVITSQPLSISSMGGGYLPSFQQHCADFVLFRSFLCLSCTAAVGEWFNVQI